MNFKRLNIYLRRLTILAKTLDLYIDYVCIEKFYKITYKSFFKFHDFKPFFTLNNGVLPFNLSLTFHLREFAKKRFAALNVLPENPIVNMILIFHFLNKFTIYFNNENFKHSKIGFICYFYCFHCSRTLPNSKDAWTTRIHIGVHS